MADGNESNIPYRERYENPIFNDFDEKRYQEQQKQAHIETLKEKLDSINQILEKNFANPMLFDSDDIKEYSNLMEARNAIKDQLKQLLGPQDTVKQNNLSPAYNKLFSEQAHGRRSDEKRTNPGENRLHNMFKKFRETDPKIHINREGPNLDPGIHATPNDTRLNPRGTSSNIRRISPSRIDPIRPDPRSSIRQDDLNLHRIPEVKYTPAPVFTTEDIPELEDHSKYLQGKIDDLSEQIDDYIAGLPERRPTPLSPGGRTRQEQAHIEDLYNQREELIGEKKYVDALAAQLDAKKNLQQERAPNPLRPGSKDYAQASENYKQANENLASADAYDADEFKIGGTTNEQASDINLADVIPSTTGADIDSKKDSLTAQEANRSGAIKKTDKTVNTDFLKSVKKHEIKSWSATATGQMNGTGLGALAKEVADNMGITLNSKNYNSFANELAHHDTDAALTQATVYDKNGDVLKEAGERWSSAQWKSLQAGNQVEFAPESTAKISTEIQNDRLAAEQQEENKNKPARPMGMK